MYNQLNVALFSALHEYIKSTKRFDNTLAYIPLIIMSEYDYIRLSLIPLLSWERVCSSELVCREHGNGVLNH